jgi:hypothetical protein
MMREQIREDLRQLAVRCVRAGVTPESVIHLLLNSINQERNRLLIEAEGFVTSTK